MRLPPTAIVVLAGFAAATLFGVFLMAHSGTMENHAGCLPTLMGESICKTNINPIEYVRVHLGALTELTNVIPVFGAMAISVFLIILLCAASILESYKPLLALLEHHSSLYGSRWRVVQEKFLKWTALHEKRDPSFALAAST